MADDPTIRWMLANPFGIQIDENQDAWHSGHVNDILELDSGGLLVGTHTGGVWSIDTNNTTLPLSNDWPNPNVNCLCLGPYDSRQVFAGCTGGIIRETDLGEALPLFAWREIDKPLPANAGDVHRIVVIRNLHRIIAACDHGIFWATIPPISQKRSCLIPFGLTSPPRIYDWKKAKVEGAQGVQGFWDVAVATTTRSNQTRSQLEDINVITIVAGGFRGGGLFFGQWNSAGDLVLKLATTDTPGLISQMGSCSVSSCETYPTVVYASCAGTDGFFLRVLRSEDGGQSWTVCNSRATSPDDDLVNLLGEKGRGNDYYNCISVSPTNTGLVALGWMLLFITPDSGQTWKQVENGTHLHKDYHALRFIQIPNSIGNLYVGSDGGVARINLDDYLGLTGQPFQSNYNRQLPTLQCYSTYTLSGRNFYGTLGASKTTPGLIATGTQDNANVYCVAASSPTPWREFDGGDGGWNAFLANGVMLHSDHQDALLGSGLVSATIFNTGPVIFPSTTRIVPVSQPPSAAGIDNPYGEPVARPSHYNATRQLLQAVASQNDNNQIFGLYGDDFNIASYNWELIASIPLGEAVSALASYHGGSIFAGTLGGKMYVIDTQQKKALEIPVVLDPNLNPAPATQKMEATWGQIKRIVVFNETESFAMMNDATVKTTQIIGGSTTIVPAFFVLRLDGVKWVATRGNGMMNKEMFGLEAVALPHSRVPRALFITMDDRVFISRNDGEDWQQASLGLPRNPHCADLRFASFENEAYLYLSTFGRSVWVAKLQ